MGGEHNGSISLDAGTRAPEPLGESFNETCRATSLPSNLIGSRLREPDPKHTSTLFRLLVESVTEYAIFMIDFRGQITSWNEGAHRLLQYTEDEVLGKPVSILFTKEDICIGVPERELEKAARLSTSADDRWHVRKDGTKFWASGVLSAVFNDEGELIGFSKLMRDNTDRKLAEETLKQRAKQLARSNEELERFAYVSSHDLKEPLRTVSSYLQLLQFRYSEKLSLEADEYIGYAVDGVRRMYTLIDDLLTYSQVGTSKNVLELVNTEKVFREVCQNLDVAIREAGADAQGEGLPEIVAVRSNFVQLLQNLLSNALKFRGSQRPTVRFRAETHDTHWLFSVADNGIGIDPSYSEKIFMIFQRLHTRTSYPGNGIGLALCKKIVEKHHGHIWFESKAGEGTVFYFTIRKMPLDGVL